MAVAAKDFYKINGLIIPIEHKPQFCSGVVAPQGDGETNLLGERTGARGGYTCRLWWEVMSVATYQWWVRESNLFPGDLLSAPATELILPDMEGVGSPVPGRAWHGQFWYGIVSRPIVPEDVARRYLGSGLNRIPYFMGTIEIRITHIGENPPI